MQAGPEVNRASLHPASVHTGANGRVVESSTACQTPLGRKPSRVGRVGGEHVRQTKTVCVCVCVRLRGATCPFSFTCVNALASVVVTE